MSLRSRIVANKVNASFDIPEDGNKAPHGEHCWNDGVLVCGWYEYHDINTQPARVNVNVHEDDIVTEQRPVYFMGRRVA